MDAVGREEVVLCGSRKKREQSHILAVEENRRAVGGVGLRFLSSFVQEVHVRVDDLGDFGHQLFADGGKAKLVRVSDKQIAAELLLELAHGAAHALRGDEVELCRLGDRLRLRDVEEVVEVLDVHRRECSFLFRRGAFASCSCPSACFMRATRRTPPRFDAVRLALFPFGICSNVPLCVDCRGSPADACHLGFDSHQQNVDVHQREDVLSQPPRKRGPAQRSACFSPSARLPYWVARGWIRLAGGAKPAVSDASCGSRACGLNPNRSSGLGGRAAAVRRRVQGTKEKEEEHEDI